MTYCGECGESLQPQDAFCTRCGRPVGAPAAQQRYAAPSGPPPTYPSPGTVPRTQAGRAALPPWAVQILTGNWIGSATVAAAVVGTSLLVSLVLTLIGHQDGMGARDTLTFVTALMAGAFGADLSGEVDGFDGHVGAFPLTITLLALLAGVLAFRRVTARYPTAGTAVADAARAALIAGLAMMVFALVFTTRSGDSTVHAGAAGAFFLTFLIVFLVLALTVLLRRDWLQTPVTRVIHDWVRAPVLGLAAMLVLLPVAGAIAALAVLVFGSGSSGYTTAFGGAQWRLIVVGVIAYAGNIGLWALTLGTGGRVAVFGLDDMVDMVQGLGSLSGNGGSIPTGGRLTWFTGTFHEPGLWVTVVLTPLWLALAALVVVRAAGHRSRGGPGGTLALRALGLWVLSLLVAIPYAVRLANVHAGVTGPFGISLSPTVGASGVGATFLLLLDALVVGVVVALAVGALDGVTLRRSAAAVNRRFQQAPATRQQPVGQPSAAQPPVGQPPYARPSGPPPGPPPAGPRSGPPTGPPPGR